MTSVLLRRAEDTDTGGGAETGVMQQQVEEHLGPPEAGRGREQVLSQSLRRECGPAGIWFQTSVPQELPSEGVRPCWYLRFRLLSPRNWERTRFCCFKPPGAEGLKPWPAAVASPQGPGCLHAAAAAQKAQASSPELWSHLGRPSTSQPQQGDEGRDDGTGPLGQPSLSGPCLPLESLHMAGRI